MVRHSLAPDSAHSVKLSIRHWAGSGQSSVVGPHRRPCPVRPCALVPTRIFSRGPHYSAGTSGQDEGARRPLVAAYPRSASLTTADYTPRALCQPTVACIGVLAQRGYLCCFGPVSIPADTARHSLSQMLRRAVRHDRRWLPSRSGS